MKVQNTHKYSWQLVKCSQEVKKIMLTVVYHMETLFHTFYYVAFVVDLGPMFYCLRIAEMNYFIFFLGGGESFLILLMTQKLLF